MKQYLACKVQQSSVQDLEDWLNKQHDAGYELVSVLESLPPNEENDNGAEIVAILKRREWTSAERAIKMKEAEFAYSLRNPDSGVGR